MDAKQRGDITELESVLAFVRLGCSVSIPYGCHEKYDFIADVGGNFIRIQCKTSVAYRDGKCFTFDVRRKLYVDGKRTATHYDEGDFDYYATTFEGKCYLVPFNECFSRKILRLEPAKNGMVTKINMAEDYLLENIIKKIGAEI